MFCCTLRSACCFYWHNIQSHKCVVAKTCTWNTRTKGGEVRIFNYYNHKLREQDLNLQPSGYEPDHLPLIISRHMRRPLSFDRDAFDPFARTGCGSMLSQRLLALAYYIIQLFYFLLTDS